MYERHALFTLYTIDTRRYKLKTVTKNLIHLFLPWQENKKSDDICVEPKWLTCKSWTSRYPLYSTAVLNLNHSLGFSSSRSFCTFLKKYQKRGSRVRHSVLPLFTNCISSAAAIFFSRFTPRHSQLVAMLGAARTRCAQTSYRLIPSIARLLTVPPNAAH